ncbi:MAG: polysaccharide deacetylase family protein [Phycisphaerae bacterium]|nr:polysaccharide deacetylase family protein [Phycisphaerae bacterium]
MILYHDPSPAGLRRHLDYLKKRYTTITLDQLVQAIYEKDWSSIPPKALVITIDDGHRGNYALASLFEEYDVKPTIYLTTAVVGSRRHFWWRCGCGEVQQLKRASNGARLRHLEEAHGYTPRAEYPESERQALSWDEIARLGDTVDCQSHSRFHPVLTTCTDEECWTEILGSKQDLDTRFERGCLHFSYPNGNYGDREIAFLKKAGFLSARSLDIGWNDVHTDPYKLRITGVTDDASVNVLAVQLSGLSAYVRYTLGRWLAGRQKTARIGAHSLGEEPQPASADGG